MNKPSILTALTLALGVGAGTAVAGPINLDSVSGQWHTPEPEGIDVTYEDNNSSIYWGASTGYGQSGYSFTGPDSLPQSVDANEEFILGSLTHHNMPITGDAITGVSLDVMADFSTSGENADTGPYQFQFTHEETPNTAPEDNWVCGWFLFWKKCWEQTTFTGDVDDIIYLDEAITSSAFEMDNHIYSLDLLGFKGGEDMVETPENESSSIDLIARLNVDAASVPEPGTIGLLGLGLVGLGFARRRRG